jgi:sterol desaturase/sphingolipid hydroxylase (fatty acid hydroxylase superfamily)
MAVFGRPIFFECCCQDDGTISIGLSYIDADEAKKAGKNERSQTRKMKEAGDIFRIVGIVFLVIVVLALVLPFVFALLHIAVGLLVWLAITVIKVAIVVAIIYLVIVGIRAVLR